MSQRWTNEHKDVWDRLGRSAKTEQINRFPMRGRSYEWAAYFDPREEWAYGDTEDEAVAALVRMENE